MNSPELTTNLTFDLRTELSTQRQLVSDFLETLNVDVFLGGMWDHYEHMREISIAFEDEPDVVRAFVQNGWRPFDLEPEAAARKYFFHEHSHRAEADKYGVGGTIRVVPPADGHLFAYVELDLDDLYQVTSGDPAWMLYILGKIAEAPTHYPDASPYDVEEQLSTTFAIRAFVLGFRASRVYGNAT